MINAVRDNLKNYGVKPDALLIVAVSGGPDSVCLLHLLSEIGKDYPFQLHVGHLNHSLRGREADEDAEFVKKYSDSLAIPSTFVKKDIASLAKAMKKSKQETARLVRYKVLQEILKSERGDWIVTAHQAEDQAETFLMRLIRGSGSHGLSSIPKVRGAVLRPFLQTSRTEILDYLKQHHLAYREDSSNQLPIYFRNRVRQELLPILKKYNPGIVQVLGHEADIILEEDRFMEEVVSQAMPEVVDFSDKIRPVLKITPFLKQPLALQRRLLRSILFHLRKNLLNIHFNHIQRIFDLARSGLTGKSLQLPDEIEIYKCYETLVFIDRKLIPSVPLQPRTLPVPGEVSSPEMKMTFRASLTKGALIQRPAPNEILLDLDQIILPLTVRTRKPGDPIYPVRLRGKRKKLQDLFVDLKISRPLRDVIPLIAGADRILWVMGKEQDYKSIVSASTKVTLRIEVKPLK